MSVRIRAAGRPITGTEAAAMIAVTGEAAAAERDRYRKRGDHAGRILGPTAGRVLVTRTDVGSRNAALTTPVRGTGRKNPSRSDVKSVRFGDGDRRGFVTATRRDSFGHESGNHVEHRHYHRHADGTRCDCPVAS